METSDQLIIFIALIRRDHETLAFHPVTSEFG